MDHSYITTVAGAALGNFDTVIEHCGLGGGKSSGKEYLSLNPKRSDSKLGSLSISKETGAGSDFATGDRWGDLVGLAAWRFDCSQLEAADRLADLLGIQRPPRRNDRHGAAGQAGQGQAPTHRNQPASAPKKPASGPDADGWACVLPVPADAPPPPVSNPRQGRPKLRYRYGDAAGALLFLIDRYEGKSGKSFGQLTWWQHRDGRGEWRWKAAPAPRALYGLDLLAQKPAAPVLVCEGEKAADAARLLFPDWVVVSWPGGANAVDKADWSPLAGREVTLWPDLDEAGESCAAKLVGLLCALPVPPAGLYRVQPQAFGLSAKGDDAADLLGWDAGRCTDVCTRETWRVTVDMPKPEKAAPATKPAADKRTAKAGGASKSGCGRGLFALEANGVFLAEIDRDGNESAPKWICSFLEPLARVRSPDNSGWGLLVRLFDPDKVEHRLVIPMALFSGEGLEVIKMLFDAGLQMAPGARQKVIVYLQTSRPEGRARVTARTGWHPTSEAGAVFVLPSRAFGAAEGEEWIYEAEGNGLHAFKTKGSAEQWREHVGRRCSGNSRLLFVVSVAFASPLLYLVGGESGGFHYRSNSSDGKTTALKVACSVCGDAGYLQRWRATDNGLEALAMQHCDALLALDELAQLDPKVAGETAYMLANGAGKTRAARTGGARERASWRLLFLSAGEISLGQHMAEANKTARAGQEIRLVDIPADAGAGLGAWECLHGAANGAEFSQSIEQAAKRFYGAPLAAYLDRLTTQADNLPQQLREAQKRFADQHLTEQASGQARRVADRFALVAMGGELATEWGLTGWDRGEALAAAGKCFAAWLAGRGGEGKQEDRVMLSAVREFFARHGDGAFDLWHRIGDDRSPRTADCAGVRRWIKLDGSPVSKAGQIDESSEGAEFQTEYFVYPEAFEHRICKGHDYKAVARILAERGILRPDNGRLQSKLRIPGKGQMRVYHIMPTLFEDGDYA